MISLPNRQGAAPVRAVLGPLVVSLLFLAVVVGAALVRKDQLDSCYSGDELFHIAAAESILEGRGPEIAPDVLYTRALPFTKLVAWSMARFGSIESAARLPSFVSGMACVVLVFLFGWRWLGSLPGVIAAAVVAFEPYSVFYSTNVRMYAVCQLLVVAAAWAFLEFIVRAFPEPGDTSPPGLGSRSLPTAALSLFVFAVCLVAALRLHALAGDLLVAIGLFVACGLVWRAWEHGVRRAFGSGEGLVLVTLVAIFVLVVLVRPGIVETAWAIARTTALWNERQTPDPLYYAYFLKNMYPFEWIVLPLGIVAAIRTNRRAGLLVSTMFVGSLAFHSLVFVPTSPRYFFLSMPFFFLLAGSAVAWVIRLTVSDAGAGRARIVVGAIVVAFLLFALRSSPWFLADPRSEGSESWVDWCGLAAAIRSDIGPNDYVVAGLTDDMFAIRHYLPRVDAHLGSDAWVKERSRYFGLRPEPGPGPYGIPTLGSADEVLERLRDHSRVWIIVRAINLDRGTRVFPRADLVTLEQRGRTSRFDHGRIVVIQIDADSVAGGATGGKRPDELTQRQGGAM